MCLDRVNKRYDDGNDEMVVGYKVFRNTFIGISGEYYGGPYELGEEYEASSKWVDCRVDDDAYKSGFHMYKNLKDAILNSVYYKTVYEVHGWGLICEGTQLSRKVYVTKYMRIVKRIDDKE
jgi:outer membrane protease